MKCNKRMAVVGMTVLFTLGMASAAFAGTWSTGKGENENNWWYDNGDGTYASNGWQWIDGNNDGVAECYYFDTNGWLLTNTVTPDGFNVNADGAWVNNGQVETKNMEQEPNHETSNIDGQYTHTGYYYNGEFVEWKRGVADATIEYIILTKIDENTVKAEVWGLDVNGSEEILKKDGDTYRFESGKLSDTDIQSGLYDNGEDLQQYIYELHIEDDTLEVIGAWWSWDGVAYQMQKKDNTVSIFKR